jgi:hypothetical protein
LPIRDPKSVADRIKSRVEACKKVRSNLIAAWRENVNYRRGTPFSATDDYTSIDISEVGRDRVNVPVDWAMTKQKQAQLFSQVPQVMLSPKHPAFGPAVPIFAKVVNDTLTKEKVGVAMDEVLPDVINAAGIGAVIVTYEARTEQIEVPAIDPSMLAPEQLAEVPTVKVDRVVDQRFPIKHINPEDLLWDTEFTGSDADDAPWIGRSGRMTWAEAKNAFSLRDEDREKVVSAQTSRTDRITQQDSIDPDSETVCFDELFYGRHYFHADEKYFKAIHHIVFVNGLDTPVIDEQWKGQRFEQATGSYVGACRYPIRILKLTHISGEFIPPSDSAIGRPQVNELIRSRSQIVQQRDHSVPIRWADINRIDPLVMDALMKGSWQGIIPTQGNGNQVIGEVARAMYPREDFEFDRVINSDLQKAWSVGPNQMGTFASGERSASEAQIVQSSFQTEIGYQRAKVAEFFVSIAEVLAGLLALYGRFDLPTETGASIGPEGAERLQTWDRSQINGEFVYSIRSDSTIRLDAQQRIQQLMQILDIAGKAPFVNPEPIIREIIELSGLDPADVMVQPQPKGPEPLNVSIRNREDLNDPLMLALLMKTGQAPTPQELEAAKQLLIAASTPPAPTAQLPEVDPLGDQLVIPGAEPLQAPVPFDDARPDWTLAPRINKRRSGGQ